MLLDEHCSGAFSGSGLRRAAPRYGERDVLSRTSIAPQAPDCLLGALRGASLDEEHRTLMSAVIQKVSSTKSGLTEAYTSLLTGFEVSSKNM